MFINVRALFCKKWFRILSLTGLIAILFSSVKAQNSSTKDHSYGVALNAGYDVPVGNLGYTFKPAPTFGFTFLSYHDDLVLSATIGYHSYKPKQDTFYYAVDESNYGTIKYQNFTALSLYFGVAYNFELAEGIKAYGGINFGAYFTHSVYHSVDEFINDNSDLHDENIYLAPKIGLNYTVGDNVTIGIEGKYNTFIVAGKKSDNARVGTINSSYAGNLILTYNF